MNLGTLTPPRTYSAEPGAGHLFASGCIRGVLDERERGMLPCKGQAPLPTDAACIVQERRIPWQSCGEKGVYSSLNG